MCLLELDTRVHVVLWNQFFCSFVSTVWGCWRLASWTVSLLSVRLWSSLVVGCFCSSWKAVDVGGRCYPSLSFAEIVDDMCMLSWWSGACSFDRFYMYLFDAVDVCSFSSWTIALSLSVWCYVENSLDTARPSLYMYLYVLLEWGWEFLRVRVIRCCLLVCKRCSVRFYLWEWFDASRLSLFANAAQQVFTCGSDSMPAVCLCLRVLLSEFLPVRVIRCLCSQALLGEFLPVRVIRCLCLQALFSRFLLVGVIRRRLFVFVCKCCSVFSGRIILLWGMLWMFHLPLIMKLHFFSQRFNNSLCVNMMALRIIVVSVLLESRWWWGCGLQCVLQCVCYLLKCASFICRYFKSFLFLFFNIYIFF